MDPASVPLAHGEVAHAPSWVPVALMIAAAAGALTAVGAGASVRRIKRRLRAASKERHRDALAAASRRTRVVLAVLVAATVAAATGAVVTREAPHDDEVAVAVPEPDPASDHPVELTKATATGELAGVVSNLTDDIAYVMCSIEPFGASGEALLTRTYDALDEEGRTITSDAYTNFYALRPNAEQRFRVGMLPVSGSIVRIEASCESRPIPKKIRRQLEEG